MRHARSELPPVRILVAALSVAFQAASPAFALQAITGSSSGLDMVPSECIDASRQSTPIADILVLHNKVVSFSLAGLALRSEISGGTVRVRYGGDDGVALYPVTHLIRYQATDVRLYHALLAGHPVVLWEETVENVPGRAGILEYRGRGLFPVCDGRIRVPSHAATIMR